MSTPCGINERGGLVLRGSLRGGNECLRDCAKRDRGSKEPGSLTSRGDNVIPQGVAYVPRVKLGRLRKPSGFFVLPVTTCDVIQCLRGEGGNYLSRYLWRCELGSGLANRPSDGVRDR